MGGFYKPDAGAVKLGARDLAGLPSHALALAGVGRTYQTTQLFPRLSVLDNLLIALKRGRLGSIFSALFRPLRDQPRREMAESLLAFVGYDGPIHQPAGALPHVDKRLVEIARALATQPSVLLLLDEPAAGLGRGDTERVAGPSAPHRRGRDRRSFGRARYEPGHGRLTQCIGPLPVKYCRGLELTISARAERDPASSWHGSIVTARKRRAPVSKNAS